MNENNYEYLKKQLYFCGFGNKLDVQLRENMETGAPKFSLLDIQEHEGHSLTCEPVLKFSEEYKMYHYQGFRATTQLDIRIDHARQEIETGKQERTIEFVANGHDLKMPTSQLESVIQDGASSLPAIAYQGNDPAQEAAWNDAIIKEGLKAILAIDKALFNLLVVKYDPVIDFPVDSKMLVDQHYIRTRHNPTQFFAEKYKIKPDQAFRMLAYNLWIYREMLSNKGEMFGAWWKIDFNKKTSYKNHVWDPIYDSYQYDPALALDKFAFKEFDIADDTARKKVIQETCEKFRNAELVEMTPLNPDIKNTVLISANPRYKTIYIFNHNMVKLLHAPFRKEALNMDLLVKSAEIIQPVEDEPNSRIAALTESAAKAAAEDGNEDLKKKTKGNVAGKTAKVKKERSAGKGKGPS